MMWPLAAPLQGPPGADGATGPQGPQGLSAPLSASYWKAGGQGFTDVQGGMIAGSLGTSTAVNWAATNFRTRMRWREWLVTTPATTAVANWRDTALRYTVGGDIANVGGFDMTLVWSPATGITNASHRAFAGLRNLASAPGDANPSTLANIIGMGYDSADTNVQFMHNDASGNATKIDLGASFPKPSADRTKVYSIRLQSPKGLTQSVTYTITDLDTGAVATGTVTTDLPTTTTPLCPHATISVGGVSAVAGVAVSDYIMNPLY